MTFRPLDECYVLPILRVVENDQFGGLTMAEAHSEQGNATPQVAVTQQDAIARQAAEKKSSYRLSSSSWENLKAAINNAAKLLWIAAGIAIICIVIQDLSSDIVTIEPISVPPILSQNGYTQEVASRRLRDALGKYAAKADTAMKSPAMASRNELPNIVIPKIDLPLNAIVSTIRSLLHYGSQKNISGELISQGRLIWLRLRVDDREVYTNPNGFYADTADELFADAVPSVMEKIAPYFVAATILQHDPKSGLRKADEIIARLPFSNVNVQWAYLMKGNFLMKQGRYAEAEFFMRTAVLSDTTSSIAHLFLGHVLRVSGKFNEAITEYHRSIKYNREATETDPRYAELHEGLGSIFFRKGKLDIAIAEFHRAIEIDAEFWGSHAWLGQVLRITGKFDEAILEFRRAIALNPKIQFVYNELGSVLAFQGKLDDAIVEYRNAIEVDPTYAEPHTNLGAALHLQGKLDEAITEFRRARELDPDDERAKTKLEAVLKEQATKNNVR